MNLFDRAVVSSNDDPRFFMFWPIVATAWRKFFGVPPDLVFVTKRKSDDPLITKLRKWGIVWVIEEQPGFPTPNQAKLARFYQAAMLNKSVVTIEDIDTIPLQAEFINKTLGQRQESKLLLVGAEVYKGTPHEGKIPISQMTGEGNLFKALFNPKDLTWSAFLGQFKGMGTFDKKEDPQNPAGSFSDESLVRALLRRLKEDQIQKVNRGVNIKADWIDRSWWNVDKSKLFSGNYICCNFKRPFIDKYHEVSAIMEYIFERPVGEGEVWAWFKA